MRLFLLNWGKFQATLGGLVTLARKERVGVTYRRWGPCNWAAWLRVRSGGSAQFLDLDVTLDG